jgi:CRISPR-associated protein Csm1
MTENLRHQIFLAALLHDLGEFYRKSESPAHEVRAEDFIEKFKEIFTKIPGLEINTGQHGIDSLVTLVGNHHKPQTEPQTLVALADAWSAGKKRTFKSPEMESNTQLPLSSIFNTINNGNYHSAFKLTPLSIDEDKVFPDEATSATHGEYKALWDAFCAEFKTLPTDSFTGFAESLTYLLKKYTWCIPANPTDMTEISLYEHLKTTAAFADCFFKYHEENPSRLEWNGAKFSWKEDAKPVILLGGDVSGIQNFIYNISSKKAAVSLKGRSFYLQLLVDSVIQRILSHPSIDATIAQVVYSSGGKFYMLLPNTEKVRCAVDELRAEFERSLWEEHKGALLLNLDYVPFAFNQKMDVLFDGASSPSTVGDLWRELTEEFAVCKNLKFKSILQNDTDTLFNPQEVSAVDRVCAVTGMEGKCENIGESGEEAVWVLPSVKKQIELGAALKDSEYILSGVNQKVNGRYTCGIDVVGVHSCFSDKLENIELPSSALCRIKRMNNLNVPRINGNSYSYGFQFYGGNKQAMTTRGDNKTFEELADKEYLGILRMDVDNLGTIFIKGLPENTKSFAAYSTLSFMLDWFFSGYLNTIRSRKEFRDWVNILYSGGDDVFAIGKWNQIILFAEAIRKDFAKFIGRDDISISAGITIVDPKYPIAKVAQLAGDAEDDAKKFEGSGLMAKNAVNLFGENISWQNEYDIVKDYKNHFVNLITYNDMPKSILHHLMTLCQKMKEGDMSYMWHSAYYLKRFSDGKDNAVQKFCMDLKKEICDRRKFEIIAIAARWAEIELRFNN